MQAQRAVEFLSAATGDRSRSVRAVGVPSVRGGHEPSLVQPWAAAEPPANPLANGPRFWQLGPVGHNYNVRMTMNRDRHDTTVSTMTTTMKSIGSSLLLSAAAAGVGTATPGAAATFGDDLIFLQKNKHVIVLTDKAGDAKVALVPDFQGRVMTSTATGDKGLSFGWINRELIASGQWQKHINAFGGEDRFWLGPEGGQFAIYFAKGVPFDFEHWFTPAAIDTDAFKVVSFNDTRARFTHRFSLANYSGTAFDVQADREVRLLSPSAAWSKLGVKKAKAVKVVAYESANKITNAGKQPWKKETGLLSIWILGMFTPSPATTIVVPIKPGPEAQLGVKVTSDYFGQVPPERLVVKENVVFFSGDGKFRSKIGINPKRSKSVLGSYDAANKVLTIVQFSQPAGVTDYVNSLWKLQEQPFAGDAANSYNDGPATPGAKPMGPFYELESSSPATALSPGKSYTHLHRTLHLAGTEAELDPIARAVLGVSLEEITKALPKPQP